MPCVFCQSQKTKFLGNLPFSKLKEIWLYAGLNIEKYFNEIDFSLNECDDCGISFFLPVKEGSSQFYSFLSRKNYYWFSWDYKEILKHVLNYNIKSILDYGCGPGLFLKKLPKDILKTGIDFNTKEIGEKNLKIIKSGLLDFSMKEKFDAITCVQVLEHLREPAKHIEKILGLLDNNGFLFISVPNRGGVLSRIENRGKPLDFPPHHLTRWSKKTLEKIAEIYNLKIISIIEEPLSYIHFKWSRQAPISVKYLGRDAKNLFLRRALLLKEEIICPFLFLKVKKEIKGHSILAIYQKNG